MLCQKFSANRTIFYVKKKLLSRENELFYDRDFGITSLM